MKKIYFLSIILSALCLCSKVDRKNPFDSAGDSYHPPVVRAMEDASVPINDTIKISAFGSDENGWIVRYLWALDGINFNDTTDTNFIRTMYSDSGSHLIAVRAVDNDYVPSKPDQVTVKATPNAPTVQASEGGMIPLNDTVTISAIGTDNNGTIVKYIWALDGINFTDTTNNNFIPVSFSDTGMHMVRVKVIDNDSLVSLSDEILLHVVSGAPVVVAMNDTSALKCDTLLICATGSDKNGSIAKYVWSFDLPASQDTTDTNVIRKIFKGFRDHQVTVKVIDNDGLCSMEDKTIITIIPVDPTVTGMNDTVVSVYDTTTLTALGNDSDGIIMKYLWALDGENFTDTTLSCSLKTVFSIEGKYKIKVKVLDDDTLVSNTDEIIVSVYLNAPTVIAMPDTTIYVNDTLLITATGADTNGTVVKYLWALNGMQFTDTTDTNFVKKVYPNSGMYIVLVRVMDDDGLLSIPDNVFITVNSPEDIIKDDAQMFVK